MDVAILKERMSNDINMLQKLEDKIDKLIGED